MLKSNGGAAGQLYSIHIVFEFQFVQVVHRDLGWNPALVEADSEILPVDHGVEGEFVGDVARLKKLRFRASIYQIKVEVLEAARQI